MGNNLYQNNDQYHNEEFNNDNDEDDKNSFEFYVFLAPYNMQNEEIGKIKLYHINSNTKVFDFIKATFKRHEWKFVHLYNAIGSCEIDKYIKFKNILHRHAIIQLVYVFEDNIYFKYKNKPIREFEYLELRDKYKANLFKTIKNN